MPIETQLLNGRRSCQTQRDLIRLCRHQIKLTQEIGAWATSFFLFLFFFFFLWGVGMGWEGGGLTQLTLPRRLLIDDGAVYRAMAALLPCLDQALLQCTTGRSPLTSTMGKSLDKPSYPTLPVTRSRKVSSCNLHGRSMLISVALEKYLSITFQLHEEKWLIIVMELLNHLSCPPQQ